MDKNKLRKLIRSLLEAAIVGTAAAGQGLALLRKKKNESVEYVLYKPSEFFKKAEGIPSDELSGIDFAGIIVGYIDVKTHNGDCWNAGEVKFSAAEKGYGPLMYELAMSDFGSLMSDKGAGTSQAARAVWQKYNQRPDIKKLPFDDVKNPKTPPKNDDCKVIPDYDGEIAYLNNAYSGAGDASGKDVMMRAHQALVGQMKAAGYDVNDVELAIRMMGDEYFGMRYRDG